MIYQSELQDNQRQLFMSQRPAFILTCTFVFKEEKQKETYGDLFRVGYIKENHRAKKLTQKETKAECILETQRNKYKTNRSSENGDIKGESEKQNYRNKKKHTMRLKVKI